jgi:hypothetical protein
VGVCWPQLKSSNRVFLAYKRILNYKKRKSHYLPIESANREFPQSGVSCLLRFKIKTQGEYGFNPIQEQYSDNFL